VLPSELFDALHQSGLHSLKQVQWAILESDGKITVIPVDEEDAGPSKADHKPI
jgi:uncharacterized membrane protein YcaP (DUF421 family)